MPTLEARPADIIFASGIITAEAFAQELRERLAEELGGFGAAYATQYDTMRIARDILRRYEPILAEAIANTELAAWIAGFDEVAKTLPISALEQIGGIWRPPTPPRMLFTGTSDGEPVIKFPVIQRAADRMQERNILTADQIETASEAYKADAVKAVGDLSAETITAIREKLAQNIRQGASYRAFAEDAADIVNASPIGPSRLETIFRTNVQAAFHSGYDDLASHPIVSRLFPYQEYLAIHDGRVDPQHLALETYGIDGTNIYRADDPFWEVFTPPWRYNCRCGINRISIRQAAQKGLREAEEWLRTGVAPPLVSRLDQIPYRPAAGFGKRVRIAA